MSVIFMPLGDELQISLSIIAFDLSNNNPENIFLS